MIAASLLSVKWDILYIVVDYVPLNFIDLISRTFQRINVYQ